MAKYSSGCGKPPFLVHVDKDSPMRRRQLRRYLCADSGIAFCGRQFSRSRIRSTRSTRVRRFFRQRTWPAALGQKGFERVVSCPLPAINCELSGCDSSSRRVKRIGFAERHTAIGVLQSRHWRSFAVDGLKSRRDKGLPATLVCFPPTDSAFRAGWRSRIRRNVRFQMRRLRASSRRRPWIWPRRSPPVSRERQTRKPSVELAATFRVSTKNPRERELLNTNLMSKARQVFCRSASFSGENPGVSSLHAPGACLRLACRRISLDLASCASP